MTYLSEIEKAVERCEEILLQVEQKAAEIVVLYEKMEQMLEVVQSNPLTMNQAQELAMKREMMKVAKKAAKKAAKKSIAVAQARENMVLDKKN